MPKFVQKSFSRGILSPNAHTRENAPGYSEAVRDLHNMFIGRTGEAYRRGGIALVEKRNNRVARIVPFDYNDKSYLIIFEQASYSGNSDHTSKFDYPLIRILDLTNKEITKRDFSNLSLSDYQNSIPVKIHGSDNSILLDLDEYFREETISWRANELDAMTYCQIGNVMVFVNEAFPPFVIRKEGNEFVFYRNFMDMLLNGDNEEEVVDVLSVFPYSYFGYGLVIDHVDSSSGLDSGGYYFDGYITFNNNHDRSGLSEDNRKFWENRLFICSVANSETDDVIVYGGIIRSMDIQPSAGDRRYRVRGELFYNKSLGSVQSVIDDLGKQENDLVNLYVCDWSNTIGWPRSVSEFENRFVYGGSSAFPAKLWFSSQPSIQRVPFGRKVTVTAATRLAEEVRTESPIYKTIYYDQIDLFNKDEAALGLVLQQTASAGGYFINDALGLSIYWIVGGDVLYIGTNRGVWISQGTDASSSNPIPFNTGFQKIDKNPVKRVFPVLSGKDLFYISRDNSVMHLRFGSERGYKAKTIDSFSREVVRDTSVLVVGHNQVRTKRYNVSYPIGGEQRNFSGSLQLNLGHNSNNIATPIESDRVPTQFISGRKRFFTGRIFNYQKDRFDFDESDLPSSVYSGDVSETPSVVGILDFLTHTDFDADDALNLAKVIKSKETEPVLNDDTRKLIDYSNDMHLLQVFQKIYLNYDYANNAQDIDDNFLSSLSSIVENQFIFLLRKDALSSIHNIAWTESNDKAAISSDEDISNIIGDIVFLSGVGETFNLQKVDLVTSQDQTSTSTQTVTYTGEYDIMSDDDERLIAVSQPVQDVENFDAGEFNIIQPTVLHGDLSYAGYDRRDFNDGKQDVHVYFTVPSSLSNQAARDLVANTITSISIAGYILNNAAIINHLGVDGTSGNTKVLSIQPSRSDLEGNLNNLSSSNTDVTATFTLSVTTQVETKTIEVIRVNSWIKGSINNGYIVPSNGLVSNRLIGIEQLNSDTSKLKFIFKNSGIDIGITAIEINSSNISIFAKTDISQNPFGFVSRQIAVGDYGSEQAQEVFDVELDVSAFPNETSQGEGVPFEIILYGNNEGNEVTVNTITGKLKQEADGKRMEDSILNNYSGEFIPIRVKSVIDAVSGDASILSTGIVGNRDYQPSSLSRINPRLSFSDKFALSRNNMGIEINNWLQFLNNSLSLNNYNFSIEGANNPLPSISNFNVTPTLVNKQVGYEVFKPDTRLYYDWVKKALMIFRDDNYLAWTYDEETEVNGWTKGNLFFSDVIYMENLKFKLPNQQPAIFGVRDSRIFINVAGLNSRRQSYIDELPNCLDEHILFRETRENLNLGNLKTLLLSLGYENEDEITVCVKDKIFGAKGKSLINKTLSELSGEVETLGNQNFIIGKTFLSRIVTWPPMISTRRMPSIKGHKYAIQELILFAMYITHIQINTKPAQLPFLLEEDTDIDKIQPYEYKIDSEMSYDSLFKLLVTSPFPFAVAGWALEVEVGG